MSKVNCLVCGTEFEAQRSTAKYCSDVCRVQWHRDGKSDVWHNLNGAKWALQQAIENIEANPHWATNEVYEHIQEIRSLVKRLDNVHLDQSKLKADAYPLVKEDSLDDSN